MLQYVPVPVAKMGGGLVGGLQEATEGFVRIIGRPHGLVRQHKFAKVVNLTSGVWIYGAAFKALRFRIGIGVKCCLPEPGPGPKSCTVQFV